MIYHITFFFVIIIKIDRFCHSIKKINTIKMQNDNVLLYKNIQIIIRQQNVYLYNKLKEPIEALIYETNAMFTTDDVIAVSSTPKYQILNIPENTAVFLEQVDRWEDGRVSYYLTEVKTKSIDFKGSISLRIKSLSGMVSLPKTTDSKVTKLGSSNGFTVNTNKEDE